MNGQTTLTEDAPLILDATCSFGKVWPRMATIRIDIRPEVHPDIVMDARHLRFPDSCFDEIYCDPPHMFRRSEINLEALMAHRRRSGRLSANSFKRYGFWRTRAEWHDFIQQTNKEFRRCLKPSGVLHYKLADGKGAGNTHIDELLEGMTNFTVIEDRITDTKSNYGKVKVHWLTMKPKPKESEPE